MKLFNVERVLRNEPVAGAIPPARSLLKDTIDLAWPSVVESFLVALVGFIDNIMVSSLGTFAIAAVGPTTQPKFICLCLFFSLNTAVSSVVARRRGEENRDSAVRILRMCLGAVMILTAIISTLAIIFADPIIRFAGAQADTQQAAVEYFR
ncbi:MAG: MATE family efflux transporter, partial [Clostridia bacterium]|nr:MATE family efflux transporter [Clostridia bacterium]